MSDNRRAFLTAAMTMMASSVIGARQSAGGSRAVAQRDAPAVNLEGWQMTATEITLPAGAPPGRKHRHPGFVIGYVIEGQYSFAVNDKPAKVYNAGEMFFESFDAPGEVHSTSGNPSATQPTKFLAIVFTKKGDPVTIPG